MTRRNKSLLTLIACACFLIAVLESAGIFNIDARISWTNLGLFFGFLAFAV